MSFYAVSADLSIQFPCSYPGFTSGCSMHAFRVVVRTFIVSWYPCLHQGCCQCPLSCCMVWPFPHHPESVVGRCWNSCLIFSYFTYSLQEGRQSVGFAPTGCVATGACLPLSALPGFFLDLYFQHPFPLLFWFTPISDDHFKSCSGAQTCAAR